MIFPIHSGPSPTHSHNASKLIFIRLVMVYAHCLDANRYCLAWPIKLCVTALCHPLELHHASFPGLINSSTAAFWFLWLTTFFHHWMYALSFAGKMFFTTQQCLHVNVQLLFSLALLLRYYLLRKLSLTLLSSLVLLIMHSLSLVIFPPEHLFWFVIIYPA